MSYFVFTASFWGTEQCRIYEYDLTLFQGPALCAFNDAKFEERDWQSLLMLRDSLKQEDPLKIGKFGLGFKSVFHITGNSTYPYPYL